MKDYEVCFTNGDVFFVSKGKFGDGVLVATHITGKQVIVYIRNCFYILEIDSAVESDRARRNR